MSRRIYCLVKGAIDGFSVFTDPDLNVEDLKEAIYNKCFSTQGSASATDTTRLWKVCRLERLPLKLTWV